MERVFGLPAHPLLVHAPVVLIPFGAIFSLVLMLRPKLRARVPLWLFPALCALFLTMTFLATQSGEQFDELLKGLAPIKRHQELAETTELLVAALFGISLVQAFIRWRASGSTNSEGKSSVRALQQMETLLSVAVPIVAIVATIWLIRTGHAGAEAVWEDTVK
jgi:uncharacterized membrane protein